MDGTNAADADEKRLSESAKRDQRKAELNECGARLSASISVKGIR